MYETILLRQQPAVNTELNTWIKALNPRPLRFLDEGTFLLRQRELQ